MPGAVDAPAAAWLPGTERKAVRGPAAPLAAGEAGAVPTAVRLPGTVPRTLAERVAAADTVPTAPPASSPAPGRKAPPGPALSRHLAAAPRFRAIGPTAAVGAIQAPGAVLCLPAPGDLPAMCRQTAVLNPPARQRRRDSPAHRHPGSPTVLIPVRQEAQCPGAERLTLPRPGPARQERRLRADRPPANPRLTAGRAAASQAPVPATVRGAAAYNPPADEPPVNPLLTADRAAALRVPAPAAARVGIAPVRPRAVLQ